MKAYPAYKDSGVIWFGTIPSHWKQGQLKYLLESNDGGVWGDDTESEGTIVLRSTEITLDGQWRIDNPAIRSLTATEIEKTILKVGDLLITKSSGSEAHIGKTALVTPEVEKLRACYSNFMQRICPNSKLDSHYLHYFMNSSLAREQYNYQSTTTTGLANLNSEIIRNLRILFLPIPEQQAIADFLDRKTVQIDRLIEKKQRQIGLLQEQRMALVNQAVTKGLNPDASMKDSGVEWLGEIPRHWQVKRLRRYAVLVQTGPFGSQLHASDYVPNGYPVVNPANMIKGEIIPDENKCISDEKRQELSQHILQQGDIVFARRGELGRAVLITKREVGWLCGTGSILIRFNEFRLNPDYISLYLQLPCLRDFFISSSVGSTMDNLNSQILLDMPLIEPPRDEQIEITSYIFQTQEKINHLTSKMSRQIQLLQEYRTTLISEAVTGKIDVRND